MERITTYRAFWPYYLNEHAKPQTRLGHIAGTTVATVLLVFAVLNRDPWLLLAAIVSGYGPAWFTHLMIEKNRPVTFKYPVWSLISDFRLCAYWFSGGLWRELQKAGIKTR
jgi:hypothetical protein